MKIHTDAITSTQLTMGQFAAGVALIRCERKESRSRDHAYDIALSGSSPYRTQADRNEYAATWDEWGIFLAKLFAFDPEAICGEYKSAEHFHAVTRDRFYTLERYDQCRLHRWDYRGDITECRKCGAEWDTRARFDDSFGSPRTIAQVERRLNHILKARAVS